MSRCIRGAAAARTLSGTALATLLSIGSIGCFAEVGSSSAGTARTALAGQRLGETRERVLEALSDGASPARCTAVKLAPRRARNVFPLERCVHAAAALARDERSLGGHPLAAVVTHFVDGRLVRVDARLVTAPDTTGAAGEELVRALRARLDARFTPTAAADRWAAGEDIVVLARQAASRVPDGTDAPAPDAVRVTLLDGRVAARLPGLLDEPPGDLPGPGRRPATR